MENFKKVQLMDRKRTWNISVMGETKKEKYLYNFNSGIWFSKKTHQTTTHKFF